MRSNIEIKRKDFGDHRSIVIRYISPQWRGFVHEAMNILVPGAFLLGSTGAVCALWENPSLLGGAPLTGGRFGVAAIFTVGAMFVLCYGLHAALRPWLQFSTRIGGTAIVADFARDSVVVFVKGKPFPLNRSDGEIRFTAAEHPYGEHEQREQQRVSMTESGQKMLLPFTYRDARVITVQQGELVFPLAQVAYRLDAEAIARALQHDDAKSTAGWEGYERSDIDPLGEEAPV